MRGLVLREMCGRLFTYSVIYALVLVLLIQRVPLFTSLSGSGGGLTAGIVSLLAFRQGQHPSRDLPSAFYRFVGSLWLALVAIGLAFSLAKLLH
jgi:hypothetical protein